MHPKLKIWWIHIVSVTTAFIRTILSAFFKRFRYPLVGTTVILGLGIIYINLVPKVLTAVTYMPPGTVKHCSQSKILELLEPATSDRKSVQLNCSYTFKSPNTVVTKAVSFIGSAADNATLDCNGGTIDPAYVDAALFIRSKAVAPTSSDLDDVSRWHYDRPSNVTIKNCTIKGVIAVRGMGEENSDSLRWSSYVQGHTERAQRFAPYGIVLDHLTVDVANPNATPIYFSTGVSYSKIMNSTIVGRSDQAVIYLAGESGHNTIMHNYIRREYQGSTARELLAIDGSADNLILANRFSTLNHGGIYLYRNCGEGGVIRHQEPSRNKIMQNHFYYRSYNGSIWGTNPAIWVSSRDKKNELKAVADAGYCGDDHGFPFGSSRDDRDHAHDTVIVRNVFSAVDGLDFDEMVQRDSGRNYIIGNARPTNSQFASGHDGKGMLDKSTVVPHPGCFQYGSNQSTSLTNIGLFVPPGKYLMQKKLEGAQDVSSWTSAAKKTCHDGQWDLVGGQPISHISKSVYTIQNNVGIAGTLACPAGKKIVALRVACRLETTGQGVSVADVQWNTIKVKERSLEGNRGRCKVVYPMPNPTHDISIHSGSRTLQDVLTSGVERVNLNCQDYDPDGGDCRIMGEALCL